MSSKILLFICCLAIQYNVIAQAQKNKVSLTGKLKNFTNQVEVEDMSEFQYLLPATASAARIFVPDTAGNFQVSFPLTSPNYFRLGRNILYLSPGDNLEVFIDKNDPRSASFKGRGSEANLYLRNTPFPKGGSFITAGGNLKETPELTMQAVLDAGAYRQKQLDSVKGVTAEFRRLETARVRADIINSLNSGAVYSTMKYRLKGDSAEEFKTKYKAIVQSTIDKHAAGFVDPSLMKMVVYRDVTEDVLKYNAEQKDKQVLQDWLTATQLTEELRKISDKSQLKLFEPKISAIKTVPFRNALNSTLQTLSKFGKGDVAKDFTALELGGSKTRLSSLKGKVVYLDLWATWCGPCLAEMPNYEKLKEKYKDNKDIAFVSLSIDDSEERWKQDIEARGAKGLQWLVNRNTLTDYDIVGIPRTIIIDKTFKIADLNAPLPSAKTTEGIINSLLQ